MSTSVSLNCSNPQAFFIPDHWAHSEKTCVSAKLTDVSGAVAALCSFPWPLINGANVSEYEPFSETWQPLDILTKVNQTVQCPLQHGMQLIGLFKDSINRPMNVEVAYEPHSKCARSSSFRESFAYLNSDFSSYYNELNTTFTLGLTKSVTNCIPPRPAKLPNPYDTLDNYPLTDFINNNQLPSSGIDGKFCQTFTIVNRSEEIGNLAINCLQLNTSNNLFLNANDSIGSSITCRPELHVKSEGGMGPYLPLENTKKPVAYARSLATIDYSDEHLGSPQERFVTIRRTVTPCQIEQTKKSSIDTTVIVGSVIGTISGLGLILAAYFKCARGAKFNFGDEQLVSS